VTTVPRISYARSADGVSLVFVPWVPFSNFPRQAMLRIRVPRFGDNRREE
jgi:hypothetical protein